MNDDEYNAPIIPSAPCLIVSSSHALLSRLASAYRHLTYDCGSQSAISIAKAERTVSIERRRMWKRNRDTPVEWVGVGFRDGGARKIRPSSGGADVTVASDKSLAHNRQV
ncbi:Hypothetical protein CINCED_3A007061 [Cinara cedri]|uniref:Uncharacterized protein n=1 Tax=Cinara cedri TaxID=506608 RepID=A0A5E4N5I8_9HEMI|nr:Hypothetical protein CINCED_3A007061 [Cinara cedri]